MPRLERERMLARIVTLKHALDTSRTEPGRRALRDALADYERRLAELDAAVASVESELRSSSGAVTRA